MRPRTQKATFVPPVRRFTSLSLHGIEYRLCYDYASIARAEESAQCPELFEVVGESMGTNEQGELIIAKMPSGKQLAALWWAALMVAHPEIGFEEAMSVIEPPDRIEIYLAIIKAWSESSRDPIDPDGKSKSADPGGSTNSHAASGGNSAGQMPSTT